MRQQFPGTPEAATALNYNTIIYRFCSPTPAAYGFSGRYVAPRPTSSGTVGVTIDDSGRILLGHQKGVAIFDAKAALIKSVTTEDLSAMFVDERGRVVTARHSPLVADGGETVSIGCRPSGPEASHATSRRFRQSSCIERRSPDRRPEGWRWSDFRRLEIRQHVQQRERGAPGSQPPRGRRDARPGGKGVVVTDRDGKTIGKILQRGQGRTEQPD